MQIGRAFRGYPPGLASLSRNDIDDGSVLIFLRVMADSEHLAVEGKHMIIVVVSGKVGVDFRRHGPRCACEVETI